MRIFNKDSKEDFSAALRIDNTGNKWRWEWLLEEDDAKRKFETWLRKIDVCGEAWCVLCNKKLCYKNNGKKILHKHASCPQHVSLANAQMHTQTLPGAQQVSAPRSLGSRIAACKAVLCTFLADNCLPFDMMPDIIDLAKKLAEDREAPERVSMSRKQVMYVTTDGVGKTLQDELKQKLRSSFFSINIDEATNNKMDRMLNVVVRYFDDTSMSVKTQLLASVRENLSTAENLYNDLMEILGDIPSTNMTSCLMDNCAVMQGSSNGVEARLRRNHPNLLGISGDTVHMD